MEEIVIPCADLVVGDYMQISRGRFVKLLYCEAWKEGDSMLLKGFKLIMYQGCAQIQLPLASQVTVLRPKHICCDCCDCYKEEPAVKYTMPYNRWSEYVKSLGL